MRKQREDSVELRDSKSFIVSLIDNAVSRELSSTNTKQDSKDPLLEESPNGWFHTNESQVESSLTHQLRQVHIVFDSTMEDQYISHRRVESNRV
uniref:Uncharacterized protein n=1 Tax=Timema genevievae TaxID=629358 RepID=A0A7R9K212_TIMGE|nr:unnamed protein product [Timema genevievae]